MVNFYTLSAFNNKLDFAMSPVSNDVLHIQL